MKRITLLFILGILAVFLVAAGIQVKGSSPLDKQSLHDQATDLLSYTREANLLIDQYNQKHLTRIYLHEQSTDLDQKVMSFYDDLQSDTIEPDFEPDIRSFEPHVFAFSLALKQLSDADGQKSSLEKITSEITTEQTFFKSAVKHYE